MKTVGIIGGISPESTIDYYRLIIAAYREQRPDGSSPSIIINSIDLQKALRMLDGNDLDALVDYLSAEMRRLSGAGRRFRRPVGQHPTPGLRRTSRTISASADQHRGSHLRCRQGRGPHQAWSVRHALHHAGTILPRCLFPRKHPAGHTRTRRASLHSREILWRTGEGCVPTRDASAVTGDHRSHEAARRHRQESSSPAPSCP